MLVLDRTPFYGEGGGQVGDTGVIECAGRSIPVVDTKKNSGIYMHICELDGTPVSVGDTVTARIDAVRREAIRRNHSAAASASGSAAYRSRRPCRAGRLLCGRGAREIRL